jgi:hypothetical protein
MKVFLVGYPGSQIIVPASRYLTTKYLPAYFKVTYLNYKGPIKEWASSLVTFLSFLTDEKIIFALDDYLLAAPIDLGKYGDAEAEVKGDVVCVKLCKCNEKDQKEYPVTTQYCIWNREYLIDLLKEVTTPWEFEIKGSKIFGKTSIVRECLDYFTNSSLSSRWKGVRLDGLNMEDINILVTQYLPHNQLYFTQLKP